MKKQGFIKVGVVILIVTVGFLGMSFLGATEKHSNKRKINTEYRTVETMPINFSDYELSIEGNGVVESKRTLKMVAEASGKVVFAKNDLKDGTFAKKGEVILEIDKREITNQLFSLRSEFMNAVASVLPEMKIEKKEIYDKWYNYFSGLDINSEIPQLPEAANSKVKIKLSTRNIYSKYFNIKNKEILLSKHIVKAPFEGFIESNDIIENSFIAAGQQICTFIDSKNLEIAVPLLVEEFEMINFTKSPIVKIYPEKNSNQHLTGRILRYDSGIDRNSQTLDAFVSFSNNGLNPLFLPGNYVRVEVSGKKLNDVAEIPRYTIDNESYIFTMEDFKLAKKLVDVVAMQNDMAIIKNTLPENTKLVTTILQKPLIGMNIQTLDEPYKTEEIKAVEETISVAKK
ncbi:MAG: HlyD family efflux transporter periplasmic adaptor subunit [Ignavibacteriae bacterium]|jgi:multidrug efflux pump subunit AcrA (membrane-fusion protein)|nr:HlyD family efflux transporter periplasmic adaptor subunit [Ignavibacteriota bacterium]NOG98630.1 HlyD family efflux transporter periplasmic adaptor subunit [Ignavibacteriota bacterium]